LEAAARFEMAKKIARKKSGWKFILKHTISVL
jgi:hypothetical protein